jgi:Asp-tRNA(Asn)/Glu-tRNA(Gln) amidotransferase A subunit family amidase
MIGLHRLVDYETTPREKVNETPLYFKTITEVAELIKSRQLSPVEVTAKSLERIDQLDSRLKSYATVTAERAMTAARKAEQSKNRYVRICRTKGKE